LDKRRGGKVKYKKKKKVWGDAQGSGGTHTELKKGGGGRKFGRKETTQKKKGKGRTEVKKRKCYTKRGKKNRTSYIISKKKQNMKGVGKRGKRASGKKGRCAGQGANQWYDSKKKKDICSGRWYMRGGEGKWKFQNHEGEGKRLGSWTVQGGE